MKYKIRKSLFIIGIIFLLLPPIIFCVIWYAFEYEKINIFKGFVLEGNTNLTLDDIGNITALTDALYENDKDNFPLQFNERKQLSEFDDFKSKVSERFTERIGVFSYLPIHIVCLVNRNKVYIDDKLEENLDSDVGAAALNQTDGYDFYAARGAKDCKSVSIGKFRESPSRGEYTYPIRITISPEEKNKRLNGEKFTVNLATSSVYASDTSITISLNRWLFPIFYLFTLFIWSFIFFQYKKILLFFKGIYTNNVS